MKLPRLQANRADVPFNYTPILYHKPDSGSSCYLLQTESYQAKPDDPALHPGHAYAILFHDSSISLPADIRQYGGTQ